MKTGLRKKIRFLFAFLAMGIIVVLILYLRIQGRTQLQFDIHQNQEAIYLSTFAEPPQFAIWIEDAKSGKRKTVFVTSRVSLGDWEGKKNVPVALPRWFKLFKAENEADKNASKKDHFMAVTGATPKAGYFSVRIEVPPGSLWKCWIEMNLAGDFNESYPRIDLQSYEEDEFSCGQPALLYYAEILADEGRSIQPSLVNQSVWREGINFLEPVSEGVTTARNVFDEINISVLKPKIRLIEKKVNP